MGNIKKLAGQTIWYGLPTIAQRMLGFVLQLFLTSVFLTEQFGVVTQVYAFIPFMNVIFTYGIETSYFRFAQNTDKTRLFNTLSISLIVSSCIFTALLMLGSGTVAQMLNLPGRGDLIMLAAGILFFDTLVVVPFAKLRQEGRPRKYALVKILTITTQILFTIFFLTICPRLHTAGYSWMSWYNPAAGVEYYMLSNLLAGFLGLVYISREFVSFRWMFDKTLWEEVIRYSMPLIIVGLGGMVNEMLSRAIFPRVYPFPKEITDSQLGIFGANYKLAVLITVFIQAFRMGAEPFFFNQSKNEDAQHTYARVMKFFVMLLGAVFLVVSLFLDFWILLITQGPDKRYAEGMHIVPVLAMATVFLGIYYNLTIWYKLTNRNMTGAWITLAGALITVGLNIWWIPQFSYTGSSWATFICYAFMMTVSYLLGQKYYPVPYDVKRILFYLGLAALIYAGHAWIRTLDPGFWTLQVTGLLGMGIYLAVILFMERAEVASLLGRRKV
ncbi:lipopolysaccharide biosynthesis protein [Chitinophaga barathri]|uniref:Polysaccharide biosynthesis protein n=1 Tax=Chitinophaga barathri TaxID=1647451 RepID=A0A3N4M8Y7_9BACT|nr:oligosaccharide flippase family protein [Chitinophaga barathri]RPD40134.1 polysaccharide biosynthesis protein [Chitinophaga barathri]